MSSKACCYRKTAGAARRWETGILSNEESRFRLLHDWNQNNLEWTKLQFESSVSRKAVSGTEEEKNMLF